MSRLSPASIGNNSFSSSQTFEESGVLSLKSIELHIVCNISFSEL